MQRALRAQMTSQPLLSITANLANNNKISSGAADEAADEAAEEAVATNGTSQQATEPLVTGTRLFLVLNRLSLSSSPDSSCCARTARPLSNTGPLSASTSPHTYADGKPDKVEADEATQLQYTSLHCRRMANTHHSSLLLSMPSIYRPNKPRLRHNHLRTPGFL